MATHIDAWLTACKGGCGKPHGYHMVALVGGVLVCDGTCAAYMRRGDCAHIKEVRAEFRPEPDAPTPISRVAREKAEWWDRS